MRTCLANKVDIRETFTGTFVRFGVKHGWHSIEKTILLSSIRQFKGEIVADHLWFNLTKSFEKLDFKENDIVQFNARVKKYEKGYKGYRDDVYKPIEIDYKLSYPTKVKIIKTLYQERSDL